MTKNATPDRITVGIVGAVEGALPWARHLGSRADVDLVLYDHRPKPAERIARTHGGEAVSSLRELWDRQPAGVVLGTSYWHRPASQALRAGASLMLATPELTDVDRVRRLVAEGAAAQRTVALANPFLPMVGDVLEQVSGGAIGAVTAVHLTWRRGARGWGAADMLDACGVPAFALVQALRGGAPIRSVQALVRDDRQLLILDGHDGMSVLVELVQNAVMVADEEVTLAVDGTRGSVRVPLRTRCTAAERRADYGIRLVKLRGTTTREVLRGTVQPLETCREREAQRWLAELRGLSPSGVPAVAGDGIVHVSGLLAAARQAVQAGRQAVRSARPLAG